jgi:hypothetical protein
VATQIVVRDRSESITGVVIDHEGRPVVDAFVAVSARSRIAAALTRFGDAPSAITEQNGSFRIGRLPKGTYVARAFRKGGGEAIVDGVTTGSQATLQIRRTATIIGNARITGRTRFDLQVEVSDPSAMFTRTERMIGSSGRFVLRDLSAGRYTVFARSDDAMATAIVTVVEGETKTIDLPLAALGTITGRVVDLQSKRPIAAALVRAQLHTYVTADARTDAAGSFTIERAPTGRVGISVESTTHHASVTKPVSLPATNIGDLAVARSPSETTRGQIGIIAKSDPFVDDGPFVIDRVFDASPAAKAGFQVGDEITAIDGHALEDIGRDNAWALLFGPPGSTVTIELARGLRVTLTRTLWRIPE